MQRNLLCSLINYNIAGYLQIATFLIVPKANNTLGTII